MGDLACGVAVNNPDGVRGHVEQQRLCYSLETIKGMT